MLDRIPKPVLFGAVAVILLLAIMVIFKSAKNAGGSGDYNRDELLKAANAHNSQPNGGRTMPTGGPGGSGGYPGSGGPGGSGGYPSSGGAGGSGGYPSSGGR